MLMLDTQPLLTDLRSLIDKIEEYPVTAEQLVNLAQHCSYPEEVINFYASFAPNHIFAVRDELVAETEQVEILEHEKAAQPLEIPADEP